MRLLLLLLTITSLRALAGDAAPLIATSKSTAEGLITKLRPMIAHGTTDDPIDILLRFEGNEGDLNWRALGKTKVDLNKTFATFEFHVSNPAGKVQVVRGKGDCFRDGTVNFFTYASTFPMRLSAKNAATAPESYSQTRILCAEALTEEFVAAPGNYKIRISGKIICADGAAPMPFETGEVTIERLKPANTKLSIAEIESAAQTALFAQLKQSRPKFNADRFSKNPTIEDSDGTRWVWFTGPSAQREAGDHGRYLVMVSPDGKTVSFGMSTVHCIAQGILVQTISGALPIEKLNVGDSLWGYDTNSRKLVLTQVESIIKRRADTTLLFPCGLRLTPPHPLFLDGKWIEAGNIKTTDLFLGFDLKLSSAGPPKSVEAVVDVYDISVGEPHNFFAGGILVHNKTRSFNPQTDDPWYWLWTKPKSDKLE